MVKIMDVGICLKSLKLDAMKKRFEKGIIIYKICRVILNLFDLNG